MQRVTEPHIDFIHISAEGLSPGGLACAPDMPGRCGASNTNLETAAAATPLQGLSRESELRNERAGRSFSSLTALSGKAIFLETPGNGRLMRPRYRGPDEPDVEGM